MTTLTTAFTMTEPAPFGASRTDLAAAPAIDSASILLRRIQAGEALAVRELFDAHAPRLLKFAVWLIGDQADAEALVQETFLDIFRNRGTFELPAIPGVAFLHRLVAERCIDHLGEKADGAVPLPAGMRPSLLDDLSAKERAALMLGRSYGHSPADVAAVLGVSVEAAKILSLGAARKLRARMPEGKTRGF
jgi:RNA polymerase sigma-70 factor (ECF subfamily)